MTDRNEIKELTENETKTFGAGSIVFVIVGGLIVVGFIIGPDDEPRMTYAQSMTEYSQPGSCISNVDDDRWYGDNLSTFALFHQDKARQAGSSVSFADFKRTVTRLCMTKQSATLYQAISDAMNAHILLGR